MGRFAALTPLERFAVWVPWLLVLMMLVLSLLNVVYPNGGPR